MIILIIIILVMISFILHVFYEKSLNDGLLVGVIFSIIANTISFVVLIFLLVEVSYFNTNKKEIELLEENIQSVNEELEYIVYMYLEYENKIYDKDIPIEALVFYYPNLKSNEIIIKKIEIINEYNLELIELKKKVLKEPVIKFWLYFGK